MADKKKRSVVGEMVVYLHDDRSKPTFLIPLNDELFLAWVKRDEIHKPEWTLKSIKYIYAMKQKFGQDCTTFDVCTKSNMLIEAGPLDILMHTAMSVEQVRDCYEKHMKTLNLEVKDNKDDKKSKK
jgi:hypothetical protein